MADQQGLYLTAAFAACALAWAGGSKGETPPSGGGEAASAEHKVTPPAVLTEPADDAWGRALPAISPKNQNGGAGALRCTLTSAGVLADCSIESETPEESGFGAAALRLAPLYKLSPRLVDGAPVTAPITFKIEFPPAPGPQLPPGSHFVGQEVQVDHPWNPCDPSAGQLSSFYPPRALVLGKRGAADIQCRVSADGSMSSCAWISEAPGGFGFGDAAAKIGCQLRVRTVPTAFPILRTNIRFQLK